MLLIRRQSSFYHQNHLYKAWWYMSVCNPSSWVVEEILNQKFKVTISYILSLWTAWDIWDSISETNKRSVYLRSVFIHWPSVYFWSLEFSREEASAQTVKSRLEVKEYEKNKRKIFKAQNHNMYHVIGILLCVFPTISILSYCSQGTIEVSWEMQFSLFQLYLLNCLIEPEKISASFSTRTSVKFLFQKIWSP